MFVCGCLPKKKTLDLLGLKPDGCEPHDRGAQNYTGVLSESNSNS